MGSCLQLVSIPPLVCDEISKYINIEKGIAKKTKYPRKRK